MALYPAPRGLRVFLVVWLGQLVSLVGSSLTGFALGVWVYQHTGSVTQFAFTAFCNVLPGILLSPLAGVLVDRWSHRWTLLLSDTGAALSTLAIAALLLGGQLDVWHIYVMTAISSILRAFQGPAYIAATALLVPKQHLGRASGMIQMGQAMGLLVAPVLGALLLTSIQLQGVILLDLGGFLFALITLLSVRFPKAKVAGEAGKGSLLHEIAYGWRYVASRPGILALLLFFAAVNLLGGILEVLITPLVLSFASTVALGTILSTGGMGMLAGSLGMSLWGGPRRRIHGVLGFMLLCGLWMLIAGLDTSVLLVAVSAFLIFFGLPIINGCSQAILQNKVAPAVQGRVFALSGALTGASLPLAYAVSGPLADHVFEPLMAVDGPLAPSLGPWIGVGPGRGIGLMFVVVGLLTLVLTLVAYRYPRLRLIEDELPDALPDEVPDQAMVSPHQPLCVQLER
jgi:hypothetical protein